ncbi:DUF6233 domain-containing protein [Streptomyces sp. NPDC056323]|uniref:DUF6233 domain-containing protein n=1 Tax=unclassified Streptomyces TaxID=2593676 RepID=UPI0035D8D8A6
MDPRLRRPRPADAAGPYQAGRQRLRREQAHAALRWKIQPQRSSSAALVHRGDCALYPVEGGFLTREEAVIALAEPDIEPCQICKPETGLADG